MDHTFHYMSPLGPITLAGHGDALIGLWFDGQKYFASTLDREYREGTLPVFEETSRWLDIYFSGKAPGFTPELRMRGSGFQQAVWNILLAIPYGETTTYGAIAAQLAAQRCLPRVSAQAVGGAVGRNPISLIIPCHRVVGADGRLTGYAAGLEKKAALLRMEQDTLTA